MNILFPTNVYEKITELGYHPVTCVRLHHLWSIIAIKDDQRFNIQLNKQTLKLDSINLLRYRFNSTGTMVLDVQRIKK